MAKSIFKNIFEINKIQPDHVTTFLPYRHFFVFKLMFLQYIIFLAKLWGRKYLLLQTNIEGNENPFLYHVTNLLHALKAIDQPNHVTKLTEPKKHSLLYRY